MKDKLGKDKLWKHNKMKKMIKFKKGMSTAFLVSIVIGVVLILVGIGIIQGPLKRGIAQTQDAITCSGFGASGICRSECYSDWESSAFIGMGCGGFTGSINRWTLFGGGIDFIGTARATKCCLKQEDPEFHVRFYANNEDGKQGELAKGYELLVDEGGEEFQFEGHVETELTDYECIVTLDGESLNIVTVSYTHLTLPTN